MDNDKQSPNDTGNSGVIDPTQQAIFTPTPAPEPEPPRPTQDSSVIVGSVVEPASTGSTHPYFSNHPTQTFASGVGDIVLGSGAKKIRPKNNKKLFIVGGIILGALLLIFIVATLIFTKTQKPTTMAETDLYKYANYIFYGEEKSMRPEAPPAFYNTKIYSVAEENDGSESFVQHALTLLQDFAESYNGENELLRDTITSNQSALDSLIEYLSLEKIDMPEMIAFYLSDGPDKLQARVLENYQTLLSNQNSLLASLAENYIAMAEKIAIVYDAYSTSGCIKNKEVDSVCIENTSWDNYIVIGVDNISALSSDNEQNRRQIVSNVVYNCWNAILAINDTEAK